MDCNEIVDRVANPDDQSLSELQRHQMDAHVADCDDCQSALHALRAANLLRHQAVEEPMPGAFERVMDSVVDSSNAHARKPGFFWGAGVGAAIAATILVSFMYLGIFDGEVSPQPQNIVQFGVVLNEPRELQLAIDLKRDMPGATMRVAVVGGIQIDGYGLRREFSWNEDLVAGVNRLTLPVMATDELGGQLLVQVDHQDTRRVFSVDVRTDIKIM